MRLGRTELSCSLRNGLAGRLLVAEQRCCARSAAGTLVFGSFQGRSSRRQPVLAVVVGKLGAAGLDAGFCGSLELAGSRFGRIEDQAARQQKHCAAAVERRGEN